MAINRAVQQFLGPSAVGLLKEVNDESLLARALEGFELCVNGLQVVEALDLRPHELVDEEEPGLEFWVQIAPEVRNLLMASRHAALALRKTFEVSKETLGSEAEESLEDAFDIDGAFDQMLSGEKHEPIRDRRELELEALVNRASSTRDMQVDLAPVIGALTSMLQEDFVRFGERLKNPHIVGVRWALLGELHELQSKCAQCLQAVAAAILGALGAEDPEAILPCYTSATMRAVQLRRTIVLLEIEVEKLRGGQGSQDELQKLIEAFASSESFNFLRPLDRQQLGGFRRALARGETSFRQIIEGFSKFLEVMRSINQRQELARVDAENLRKAKAALDRGEPAQALVEGLYKVLGRDAELDDMIVRWVDAPPEPARLSVAIERVEQSLQL